MKLTDNRRLSNLRELVDSAVSELSIREGIARPDAYLRIASELGYSVRSYVGEDNWACVIACDDTAVEMASRIESLRQKAISTRAEPIWNRVRQMGEEIDALLSRVRRRLDSPNLLLSDLESNRRDFARIEALQAESRNQIEFGLETERKIASDFTEPICTCLMQSVVVFGVDTETALIALILRLLDTEVEAFFTPTELSALFTPDDIRRKTKFDHQEMNSCNVAINLFDSDDDRSRTMLIKAVGEMACRLFLAD